MAGASSATAVSGLTNRGAVVLGLGGSLAAAGIVLGLPELTRAGVLLVVLPFLARFLVARRLDLSVTRTVTPQTVTPGAAAQVELQVHNHSGASSPLLIAEERLTYALGDRPRMLLERLAPDESRRITYRARSHVRGRHTLGPLSVRVADAFGLASREVTLTGTSSLVVLPRVAALDGLPPTRGGAGGEEESSHVATLHGETDVGVREYRDGDDLRRIHWPSTARTGSMMVRQDDQPGRHRALVLLDNRASSHSGTGGAGSLEWAVSAAASAAVHLLAQGRETYLATADPERTTLSPLASIDDALLALAVVTPTSHAGGEALVDAAVEIGEHGGGTTVAVVGPLDEGTARGLTRIGHGIAFVVDPEVFGIRSEQPSATATRLATGGWRAVDVPPGARVADIWSQLTGSAVLR